MYVTGKTNLNSYKYELTITHNLMVKTNATILVIITAVIKQLLSKHITITNSLTNIVNFVNTRQHYYTISKPL